MQESQKPSHRKRHALIATVAAATLAAGVYIAGAVQFWRATPTITRDYYAEHNTARADLPADQKAWAVYHAAETEWRELANPLHQQVMALAKAFDEEQDALEAADPHYDRPEFGFENPNNPFGIPADHPLFPQAVAALQAFHPTLAEIRDAARRPVIGIPATDRWLGGEQWMPRAELPPSPDFSARPLLLQIATQRIVPVGFLRGVLQFDTIVAIEQADADRFLANVRTLLDVARQIRAEQTAIDQLVASRYLTTAAEAVDRAVNLDHQFLSADQFETLQTLLWSDAVAATRLMIDHDRRAADESIERFYSGRPGTPGHITIEGVRDAFRLEGSDPPPRWLLAALWPARLRFADRPQVEAHFAQSFSAVERLINDGPQTYPAFLDALANLESREQSGHPLKAAITAEGLARAANVLLTTRTRLQATATRLALERHKLAHGHYPDTLDELVPTYLPELPADPFNPGHPIKYLLRDNQPILYSVGSNGIDNKATPAPEGTKPASLEARFANPDGPSPDAPDADWILSPPQD